MKGISLSELEVNVMDIIWKLKECPIKEIKGKLDEKRKLAYTTVATIVWRLENKGAITRKKRR